MSFTLSIIANTDSGPVTLECKIESNCLLQYRKTHTPIIYYLSPPVVYYDSYTDLWFDPKSTTNLIKNLESDEKIFVNAKIGGSLLDFEYIVDDETTFSSYNRNKVRGQVGEL